MSETASVTFSAKAPPATKPGRYTLDRTTATAEGGKVGVGVDRNGAAFLVHNIGRQSESIALGAVASAVASGSIIPVEALVGAFAETGKLGALASAVEKAQKIEAASK